MPLELHARYLYPVTKSEEKIGIPAVHIFPANTKKLAMEMLQECRTAASEGRGENEKPHLLMGD